MNREILIENVLRAHAGVVEAVAIRDDDGEIRAFVVPDDAYMNDVVGRGDAGAVVVGKWRKSHNLNQLTKEATSAPVGFNTTGWVSSYSRQPIPDEEMREWIELTVTNILRFAPKDIYEIGCGTGLLTIRVAQHCHRYIAADFAPAVLARLREQLAIIPELATKVELMERRADDFSDIEKNSFDMVLINSVAQYFPNVAYLTKVLENAVGVVKPGGYVYIGDIRSLPLLPAFASSVELFQAPDEICAGELRDRIRRRIEREQELVISPSYFLSLRSRIPRISKVKIRPSDGHADNEMSRYRYQAILHVGEKAQSFPDVKFMDWTEGQWTLDAIRSMLSQHPNESIGFERIPNARIESDVAALAILKNADATYTAGKLRRELGHNIDQGIYPRTLLGLEEEELGFAVFLSWASCQSDGSYDACFVPKRSLQGGTSPSIPWPEPNVSKFVHLANAPGQGKLSMEMVERLMSHCKQNLSEEMIPREIDLVDTLSCSPDGSIDSEALLVARSGNGLL